MVSNNYLYNFGLILLLMILSKIIKQKIDE